MRYENNISETQQLIIDAATIINHPDFVKVLAIFNTEYNRLVEEMVGNDRAEVHQHIRGQVLTYKRLKCLREEVRELIQNS